MKVDIDEEIYIEIPEEYQEFQGAVGLLNKAIYRLVQVGKCWINKSCNDITAVGLEQSKAGLCVFRKVTDKYAEKGVVVHVDDILAHVKEQATMMERFAAELGRKFKFKDMSDAKYYTVVTSQGGEVRRREGKQGTGVFWGVNPLKNG